MYNHLGGNHCDVLKELVATLCTYSLTVLWLGPCPVVLLWASLNCLGLNLELWTAKLFSMEPLASFEVGRSSNGGHTFEWYPCFSLIWQLVARRRTDKHLCSDLYVQPELCLYMYIIFFF